MTAGVLLFDQKDGIPLIPFPGPLIYLHRDCKGPSHRLYTVTLDFMIVECSAQHEIPVRIGRVPLYSKL